ncbi:MAG: FtsW/RodA/SpoVE family cell cycle protein [Lachnospiraceae bacterium]|nr:FtsW/RodA/SpoVE family cell cycle protein [Lachnospiraceae bacterium]
MLNIKQYNLKKLNISLILVVMVLVVTGASLIHIVKPRLFTKQIIGIMLGMCVCFVLTFIDYHLVCNYSLILYAIGVILLLLIQVPGLGSGYNGSIRWIKIGDLFTIQPSEICKIIMIIVLAQLLTQFNESINNIKTLGIIIGVVSLPVLLIFIQPDLSSSLVLIFFFVIMLYYAGISYKIIIPAFAMMVPTVAIVIWYVCQPYQKIIKSYQQKRILGLFYPDLFPDIMFQQNKSVDMIERGKLYGILDGSSTENLTCKRLPIVESDFIFTSVGEVVGFIGSFVIIALLMVLVFKCFSIARNARDFTGKMICTGVSALFMFQIFANIGVVTRLLPNTGLPLPFLSYGVSALFSYFAAIGIVLNVGLQGKTVSRG